MTVVHYRRVLANPGVRMLLFVGLFARIPVIATGLTLTLHVVNGMKLGFLQAGLVGAASTAGMAAGAPAAGRFVDRHGLRPVLAVTTAAQLAFWPSAVFLPYWPLVAGAFVAGVLALPVFSLIRQCVAAAVPVEQRRIGFTLDSMLVEISYMIGPAVAVFAAAALRSWSMVLVGLGLVGSGAALLALNPPTRTEEERERAEAAVPRRQWLTPALLALLGVTLAATFVLAAAELSVVAVLKADHATRWTGLVIGLMALSSLVGGFLYGSLSRGFSPLVMIGGIAALTAPLGLVGAWPWLCLALVPSGLLCAPALSATVDAVSRRVPVAARGEAMGLHGTALTLGLAVSGPVTGFVIDRWGTGWSFAAAGLGGLLIVAAATPFWHPPRTAAATTGA